MDLPQNPWTTTPDDANGGRTDEEDTTQKLNLVVDSMDKILSLLHQLHLTVSSFSLASQLPLIQRVNALVQELDAMQRLADNCNVRVPIGVVNLIDDGKNPDEFNRSILSDIIAKNQITKGKTEAFKSLRRHLLEELDEAFPEEVETYREIRASSAAEAKRLAQDESILPNGDAEVKMED